MATKKRKRQSKKNREFFQTLLFFSTTILSIAGLIFYLWVYTEIDETMLAIEIQNQVAKELDDRPFMLYYFCMGGPLCAIISNNGHR